MPKRDSKGRFLKSARRVSRAARRFGGGVVRRAKSKPSIAVLGGLAVGPIQVLMGIGPGYTQAPIWSERIANKSSELWSRIGITYLGYDPMSQGDHVSFSGVRGAGTKGAAVGFGIHYVANITGANRVLARMKMPFRI